MAKAVDALPSKRRGTATDAVTHATFWKRGRRRTSREPASATHGSAASMGQELRALVSGFRAIPAKGRPARMRVAGYDVGAAVRGLAAFTATSLSAVPWPTSADAGEPAHLAPRGLSADGVGAPALHPRRRLGEVRVEVLEAMELKSADLLTHNDVYGIIMVEGHCARTATLPNAKHPTWAPDVARAARLPVSSPWASLCVGLFDSDMLGLKVGRDVHVGFSSLKDDDPLGRVELPLRALQPQTVYDAWLPLRLTQNGSEDDACGYVRLALLGDVGLGRRPPPIVPQAVAVDAAPPPRRKKGGGGMLSCFSCGGCGGCGRRLLLQLPELLRRRRRGGGRRQRRGRGRDAMR